MGSKLTRVRRIRFPVELIEVIDRRVDKYPGEMNFNAYVVMQLRYILLRKHRKTRGNNGFNP